jgi:hypothetical protein
MSRSVAGPDDEAVEEGHHVSDAASAAPRHAASAPAHLRSTEDQASEATDTDALVEEDRYVEVSVATPESSLEASFDAETFYKPVYDTETIHRSKRLRVTLTVVLFALLLGVCALCFAGFMMLKGSSDNASTVSGSDGSSLQINDTVDEASTLDITMPALSSLFGMTTDQALTLLGSNYKLASTSAVTTSDDSSTIVQIAEIDYQVTNTKTTVSNTPKIYLSLDADGKVVECYLSSSLDVLGYDPADFSSLVSTSDLLLGVLKKVGITPATDFVYAAPTADTYTTYTKDSSGNATTTVSKKTVTFSGQTADTSVTPSRWSVTLTYDYTTVNITGSQSDLVRMVTIELS